MLTQMLIKPKKRIDSNKKKSMKIRFNQLVSVKKKKKMKTKNDKIFQLPS